MVGPPARTPPRGKAGRQPGVRAGGVHPGHVRRRRHLPAAAGDPRTARRRCGGRTGGLGGDPRGRARRDAGGFERIDQRRRRHRHHPPRDAALDRRSVPPRTVPLPHAVGVSARRARDRHAVRSSRPAPLYPADRPSTEECVRPVRRRRGHDLRSRLLPPVLRTLDIGQAGIISVLHPDTGIVGLRSPRPPIQSDSLRQATRCCRRRARPGRGLLDRLAADAGRPGLPERLWNGSGRRRCWWRCRSSGRKSWPSGATTPDIDPRWACSPPRSPSYRARAVAAGSDSDYRRSRYRSHQQGEADLAARETTSGSRPVNESGAARCRGSETAQGRVPGDALATSSARRSMRSSAGSQMLRHRSSGPRDGRGLEDDRAQRARRRRS